MKTKLITIGDEILIGQIVNTNAAYLGDKLFTIGIPVEKTIVIGDEEQILLDELDDSLKNYDLSIITGGLGPTHDDITKTALIKFFKDELVMNEKVLEHVKNIFSSRNIEMPKVNEAQALVPKNSEVIWNANGTAPGIWIEKDDKVVIALAGVPFEMKAMIENTILNKLQNKFLNKIKNILIQKTLLTTGLGESSLNERIGDVKNILGDCKLAFLPSVDGVRLRINSSGRTKEEALRKILEVESKIRNKAGDYVYGINEETIESIIGNILRTRKQTLSLAESITGGMISSRIVSIAGSSKYYIGGICSYGNKEKVKILGVMQETLDQVGAVSKEVAVEMARGVRKLMESDYSLSTTGIAGPSGGTKVKQVGLVWIGFASKEKSYAMNFNFGDNRANIIQRSSMRALEILRRELLNIKLEF